MHLEPNFARGVAGLEFYRHLLGHDPAIIHLKGRPNKLRKFLPKFLAGYTSLGGDRSGGNWNVAGRLRFNDARRRASRRHAAPRPAAVPARPRSAVHPLARGFLRVHLQVEGRRQDG